MLRVNFWSWKRDSNLQPMVVFKDNYFSWLYTHHPYKFVVYMHALVFLAVYDFLFRYHNFLNKLVQEFWVSFL